MDLFVCSKILNTIKDINLEDYSLNEIIIDSSKKPMGFSCITKYKNHLIVGAEYSSCVYSIDISNKNNIEKIFIGTSVSKIVSYDEKILLLCSDINALLVYDMKEMEIMFEIPIGNYPFSIDVDKENKLIYVSSFLENSITIIDSDCYKEIRKIQNIEHPTKIFSYNKRMYILENKCDNFERGFLKIISASKSCNWKTLARIEVGRMPIDMIVKEDSIYVISLMNENIRKINNILNNENIKCNSEIENVAVMPSQILSYKDDLFVLDYYTGFVKKINIPSKKVINIARVKEPSAMLIV